MDDAIQPTERTPRGRHVLPLAAMVLLAAGCMTGALVTRRRQSPPPRVAYHQPVTREGVPVIRVLLTNRPIKTADLSAAGGYRLLLDGRVISSSEGDLPGGELGLRPDGWLMNGRFIGRGRLVLAACEGGVSYHKTVYRGQLHFVPAGTQAFRVINYIDMESYLAGVLAKELYPSWLPETFRAQAVAARSFALYHRNKFGLTQDYDVGDNQSSQMYGGIDGETDKAWEAVRATHGQILAVGPPGDERSFMTQYSSSCGGVVNGARVLREAPDLRPLRGGQVCPYCTDSPQRRWATVASVTKAELYRALSASYAQARGPGGVRTVRVKSRTPYGAMMWVEVIGANGQAMTVRGADLRLALIRNGAKIRNTLYSMNCRIRDVGHSIEFYDGRGYGHGVGMCQWGAQGMARRGYSARQILEFYYPGAMIVAAY